MADNEIPEDAQVPPGPDPHEDAGVNVPQIVGVFA